MTSGTLRLDFLVGVPENGEKTKAVRGDDQ